MIISSENGVVDLGEMAGQAMTRLVQSGEIEKMIEGAIEHTMKDIIDQQLRSYSELGRAIKGVVERSFEFDVERIRPGEYSAMIADLVQSRLRAYMVKEGEQQLAKMLDEILKEAPAEITMSKLVEELKQQAVDHYSFDRNKPQVTVIVEENSYGSRWVQFDVQPDKGKYDCATRFLLSSDGQVSALYLRNQQTDKFIGCYYGIERTLFWLHSGRSKLIIDKFDVEIPEEMLPEECHCD